MDLTQVLAFALQNKASDLHLGAGNPPIIRVNGILRRLKAELLTSDAIRTMVYSVMSEEQRAAYEKEWELDFAIAMGEKARFRVNAFTTRLGTAAVFRAIPTEIPTIEELDLPPIMRRFAELESGLVLITGPTGSGKSTTLAALINHINLTAPKHILTIEDPVEFFHTSKRALVSHREVGTDTKTFSAALKSALREDPDVILVGEMRDYETISLALTAAETGHLVFGTLHASSAYKTVDRVIDVFPPGDKSMVRTMLASSLQGVVAQTLLRKADNSGRLGAFEVLVGTSAVRNLIRENQIVQLFSMMQTGMRYGMVTMEDAVMSLFESGLIKADEMRRVLLEASDENTEFDANIDTANRMPAALGGTGKGAGEEDENTLKKQHIFKDGEYAF